MLAKRKLLASYTRSEQITVYTRKKSACELHLLLVLRGVTGCVTGRPVNNRNIRLCNRTPVTHSCGTYIYIQYISILLSMNLNIHTVRPLVCPLFMSLHESLHNPCISALYTISAPTILLFSIVDL